jgi:hypothetical protein
MAGSLAAGVQKRVIFKPEATYGTPDGPAGGEYLRRVTSSLALSKDTYESQEIRVDMQVADFRHGVRRVGGNLQTELSLNSFELLFAAALRQDFAAGSVHTSGVGTGIEARASNVLRQTDASSWITAGFRVGDVIRVTGGTVETANNINARIVSFADGLGTDDDMTVAETITVAADDENIVVTVQGKKSFMPLTAHTADSFTFEHHHADTDDSRRFDGCHVAGVGISVPPTGMTTLNFPIVGQDMTVLATGSAPYFTAPTAANTNSVLAAVNGTLRVAGSDVATITSLEINIEVPWTADPVVGANTLTEFFPGISRVSGQFTAYFGDEDLLNDFLAETERELHLIINAPGSAPTEFFSVFIPRLKLGGAAESDGTGGLIQTMPFQALLKPVTNGYDSTTIVIQDSTLV